MNEIDCMYYDKEFNCCGFDTDYGQPMPVFKPCYENICTRKEPKPLLKAPIGKRYHLADPLIDVQYSENEKYISTHINKLVAHITDLTDKVICDEIVKLAKEQGVTDLYLLDKEFITNAIKHEMQRQQNTKKTNFDRITESAESLAEIMDNYRWCPYFSNSTCDSEIECIECIKEWLQKECEE
jgi:hypothetical protein